VDTPRLTRYLLDHPAIELVTGTAMTDWADGPTVLACGIDARQLPGAGYLELGAVIGQLDRVARDAGALQALAAPITGHGYLAPADDGCIGVGATYEYEPWPSEEATEANLRHLTRLTGEGDARSLDHHRASRCIASDRLPVVGALVDLEGRENVERLVSVGHGSMGTVSAHLAASVIGAVITGSVLPLTRPLQALVSPRRFRTRQARRGYRFGSTP
jgi:tRNA 5-methylaminomethyl-2-thiouridine biosynthesis bifunctional protein